MILGIVKRITIGVACQLAPGAGADPCILPVTGEEPLSEAEAEQPYRLAAYPLTLPGYDGLLLRPINRPGDDHFYQIVGTAYQKMPEPAPGSSTIDREVLVARGGDIFLPGWGGQRLWHLPKGSDQWREVRGGESWSVVAYDAGTQDLYIGFGRGGQSMRWDGKAFVPAGPMPTVFSDATSSLSPEGIPRAILTLPEVGGTFAVAIDWYNEDWRSLWFRPLGGDWALVADKIDLEELAPGLLFPGQFRDADVSEDGNTVRLFAARAREASVLLKRGPDGWKLDAAAPFQAWVAHEPSGTRIALVGETLQSLTERYLLFFERAVEPEAPVFHVLGPGTLVSSPLPGIPVTGERIGKGIHHTGRITRLPGIDPLLIETADGWHAFDGTDVTALPSMTADLVGQYGMIGWVGPVVLVQSDKGVFRLSETLDAERIETFPDSEPFTSSVWIEYLDQAGNYVTGRNGDDILYVSDDLVTFTEVRSPVAINGLVAALPDRPGLLLVGPDGLYTFEADCPTAGE